MIKFDEITKSANLHFNLKNSFFFITFIIMMTEWYLSNLNNHFFQCFFYEIFIDSFNWIYTLQISIELNRLASFLLYVKYLKSNFLVVLHNFKFLRKLNKYYVFCWFNSKNININLYPLFISPFLSALYFFSVCVYVQNVVLQFQVCVCVCMHFNSVKWK